jgi:hypothetical protein
VRQRTSALGGALGPGVIVRAKTLTTLPVTRVPSLRINVSADATAASDTTHTVIAVAITILFIWHFLLE